MTVKLGLVGTGTVGGGCIDILKNHAQDFKRHLGIDVELARVCSRNPEQAIAHGVEDIFTQDYADIVNDPDIDIVIELIGGTTVARNVVLDALSAGKNVVTANKALMATHGKEVMELAERMGKEIAFEASVGGGIPIIEPLKHAPHRQRDHVGHGHRERHHQLHAHAHGGKTPELRRRPQGGAGARLRRGRPHGRRGRLRRRCEDCHPSRPLRSIRA